MSMDVPPSSDYESWLLAIAGTVETQNTVGAFEGMPNMVAVG